MESLAKPLLHYSSTIRTIRRLFADYSYYSSTIRGLFVLFVDYSRTIRTIRRLFADYSYYSSTIRTIRTIRFTILVLSIAALTVIREKCLHGQCMLVRLEINIYIFNVMTNVMTNVM